MSPAVAGMRGPEIPGFRWVRPLGQGGFADVFLYHQELPSRDVAIKVVRAQGDERGTRELHREADAMTLLAGHPSVTASARRLTVAPIWSWSTARSLTFSLRYGPARWRWTGRLRR